MPKSSTVTVAAISEPGDKSREESDHCRKAAKFAVLPDPIREQLGGNACMQIQTRRILSGGGRGAPVSFRRYYTKSCTIEIKTHKKNPVDTSAVPQKKSLTARL